MADEIEQVLDKLVKNVEASVHALYRGDMRQETAKARTGGLAREAAEAIRAHLGAASGVPTPPSAPSAPGPVGRPSAPTTIGTLIGWTREEGEAVMKCVTAWQPMGSPASATPDSKCIAAGREMVPTWGERERARGALKKIASF
jgi:hypothetical protein